MLQKVDTVLTRLDVEGDCTDIEDDRPEGCLDEPNIAKIVCTETEPCVCIDGGKDTLCSDQTYLIHTNPHINVEAPLGSGGPNGLLSMLQLWPPGLNKATLAARVEKISL